MPLTTQERAQLLALARAGVETVVRHGPVPDAPDAGGVLDERRGCFVTLTNAGRLRGCIGTFVPDAPLGKMIYEMGRAAARDPRFVTHPITPAELPQLDVEVSVLSPLTETEHPEQLQVGRDGIYLVGPGRSGCFLPEVATDQGWDAIEFLDYCCTHKAGLPADAWRDPGTKVFLFTSEKFGEKDLAE